MSGAYSEIFRRGGINFRHFFPAFFSAELILSNLSAKNDFRGSVGMLPRKNFENLHTAMVILVLFEQFLRKVCHSFGL